MGVAGMDALEQRLGTARRSGGQPPFPRSSGWVVEHTGASYRQLDYWIRCGLIRDDLQNGSGSRRRFTDGDLEVVFALVHLAALGCPGERLGEAVDAVRERPVDPAGERLVVLLDGTAWRLPTAEPVDALGPAWLIRLASFAGVQS